MLNMTRFHSFLRAFYKRPEALSNICVKKKRQIYLDKNYRQKGKASCLICNSNRILDVAEKAGLIKRYKSHYFITDYGKTNGCYITRCKGIGFSGKSILIINDVYKTKATNKGE